MSKLVKAYNSQMKGQSPKQNNKKIKQKKPRDDFINRDILTLAPSAVGIKTISTEPYISRTPRSMRIRHRELYNGAIPGSTTFTVQSTIQLQPGLNSNFPWLATQAYNWEQYKVHAMAIEYIPIVGSTTIGDVILSPDYDSSLARAPANEQQAVNTYGAVTNNVWNPHVMHLDPQTMMGLGPRRFIRTVNIPGDIKTYDVGQVFICTNNCANTNRVGKIFISYDIEFFLPQTVETSLRASSSTFLQQFSYQTLTDNTGVIAYPVYFDQQTAGFDPFNIYALSQAVANPPLGQFYLPIGTWYAEGCIYASDTHAGGEDYAVQMTFNVGGTSVATLTPNWVVTANQSVTMPFGIMFNVNGLQPFSVNLQFRAANGPLVINTADAYIRFSLA